jgi:P-type Cu+ transporter
MTKDPVCGMKVEERNAKATTQHGGRTYYFCSAGCKQKFDQRPEQYARSA